MFKLKKDQFNNWTVPSKASYLGLWIGAVGTLVGIAGVALAVYFYINPPKTPPSNSDEFVRNTNPTTVELANVEFQRWLGDPEKSLTLHYKNISELRANAFVAEAEYRGGRFAPFVSNAFKEVDMSTLSIPKGKTLELPVVPFSDLQEKVDGTVCGIGFNAIDLDHPAPDSCDSAGSVESSMIKVIASFKTIFDEEKQLQSNLWLYHCSECTSANKSFNLTVSPLLRSSNTAN